MGVLNEVLSMQEACDILGKKPATLRWWIRKGELRGRCVDGRAWIFARSEIERLAPKAPTKLSA